MNAEVEARGLVCRNGRGEWCLFTAQLDDGIPLNGACLRAVEEAASFTIDPDRLPVSRGDVRSEFGGARAAGQDGDQ